MPVHVQHAGNQEDVVPNVAGSGNVAYADQAVSLMLHDEFKFLDCLHL